MANGQTNAPQAAGSLPNVPAPPGQQQPSQQPPVQQPPPQQQSFFDVNGARREGYSDDDILDHLTQGRNFDLNGALQEGHSKSDIINYLASTPPAGQIVNDVGQRVIVPKEGESFADTLQRAVAYRKSLTPAQQQSSINAETSTIPKKTAQTLGAAAGIGTVGPLTLAAGGELVPAALRSAINAGAARATPYVKAAGQWAVEHPVLRSILVETLKKLGQGAMLGAGYKTVRKIVNAFNE